MEEDEYENDDLETKSPSALDFYDINELCDEVEDADTNKCLSSDEHENTSESSVTEKHFSSLQFISVTLNNSINEKQLITSDKPLASVLPLKYQNVDVKTLFPEYREGKVLRFLRLFGPGNPSNMPDIWRSVRKRIEIEKNTKIKDACEKSPSIPSTEAEIESDEEIKFMLHNECSSAAVTNQVTEHNNIPLNNSWRFGPAKLWYDMVCVPETAETYDYGFKLKKVNSLDDNVDYQNAVPDSAFLMVSQCNWEDNVIWDGEDVRDEVTENIYRANKAAGWIPVGSDRTVASYNDHIYGQHKSVKCIMGYNNEREDTFHANEKIFQSMFPEENELLNDDRWEDDVIWDADAMPRISYPKPLEINDNNIILKIPNDEPVTEGLSEPVKDRKDRKYRPAMKKTIENCEPSTDVDIKNNFYNISNDEYYNPKMTEDSALKLGVGGSLLQHSIPAVELQIQFFPTFMGPLKLRRFHRPPLKQYSHGPLSQVAFHNVYSLTKHIELKAKQRHKELEDSGGGEMFFMRTPEDLSGKDGDLVLFEYSEEYPSLMMQIGMASKIRNYYRRRPGKDTVPTNYKYGEIAYAHTSPFLGALQPGQSLQAYENHLFRSPIYEHAVSESDFLIIRTRYSYFIREVETLYTVGQQLPLVEVPAPKSEKANNFIRDFLMVFIYRQFWKSTDNPRRIKMEDIRKAFPSHREFSIRKRLNLCADFQRTGFDSKFWVLKSSFRLPSEDEIRQIISPEQCCAYYSMLAAEQRLKDAGYGDKFLLMGEDDTDDLQNKIDDEVKAAPWNTTQAFVSAIRGKCLLELLGAADPTGCGEGFSYAKVPNKPQWLKDEWNVQNPVKRLVKGTDADLRRLSLSSAKKLLKNFNVPEREIKKMTRWQVIDVVRTLSTEQAKLGEEGITKFARGNFCSQAEYLKKYNEECQRLFDLQNRILSSNEVLSTDEDSSSEEDSDLEEMGKHIENILSNKKSAKELSHECEEVERKELQKLVASEVSLEDAQKVKAEKNDTTNIEGKILKIYRTYKNNDGSEFIRVETVRKPEVIELYIKIRDTKNEDYIKNFAIDEEQKEAYRKERRRLQDQLRRLKRNELKEKLTKEPVKKKMKIEASTLFKVKCGACGATGHMRTNRACPLYQSSPSLPPIQVAMTEEQEEAEEKAGLDEQNLIKLDETKIIVSKQLLKHADEVRRKSLVLKIPKDAFSSAKRKRTSDVSSSYLNYSKHVNRKRIDPVVSISVIFENLINELKNLPDTQPFWFPVSSKQAPNYHMFIQKPMDLNTMKEKARQQQYKSREEFLNDITQIFENSKLYNGPHSFLTLTAKTMLDHCIKSFSEKEEKLMYLEKTINPLLDDDQVAFSFMLETIVIDQLKSIPESWPFHKPVDKRAAKGYYDIIKTPMDLDTIVKNCKSHKYKTRTAFESDVNLILSNCIKYNGMQSQFTKIAQQIVDSCHVSLEMYEEQLQRLEIGIKNLENANTSVNNHNSLQESINDIGSIKNLSPHSSCPVNCHKNECECTYNGSVIQENDHESVALSYSSEHLDRSFCNESGVPSNSSESVDMDAFLDIETVDINKNHAQSCTPSERESAYSYEPKQSNISCIFSPAIKNSLELKSDQVASPVSLSSKSQSLFPVNGILKVENMCHDSSADIPQPFPQSTCDNICDDLMLSESDSDENISTDAVLQF